MRALTVRRFLLRGLVIGGVGMIVAASGQAAAAAAPPSPEELSRIAQLPQVERDRYLFERRLQDAAEQERRWEELQRQRAEEMRAVDNGFR